MNSRYKFCILLIFQLAAVCSGFCQNKNYVISRTYKQSGAGANEINNINIQVQYLDGIGRPIQNVSVGSSKSGQDIAVPIVYDGFGRKIHEMLPFSAAGNGSFKDLAVAAQASFYSTNGAELDNSDLARAFKRTTFETSPNGRVLNERAPGSNSDSSKVTYGSNLANEVKLYNYSAGNVTESSFYPAGRLFKTTVTDENGKVSVEFKDSDGLVICNMQKDGNDKLETYYVYDDLNRLRAVLQPKYQDEASLAKFAFMYTYDNRGRMTSKSIPSQGTTFMVYDNFDRVVLSQDRNQAAAGKWAFSKYDLFSRIVVTGQIASSKTQAQWQSDLNASAGHHESRVSSTVGYTLSSTLPSVTEADVLDITYYDDYAFQKPSSLNFAASVLGTTSTATPKNMKTGGKTKMLTAAANWLTTALYYDSEYRVIQQTRELDGLGTSAYERVSTKYKYNLASVVETEQTDQLVSGSVTNSLIKTFTYDHADRLLNIKEKIIIGTKTREATTVAYRYNELGQLKEKWLHSEDGVKFRRQIKYTDNIRGWQTSSITRYWPTDSVDTQYNFYGLQYDYKQGSGKYTNGNISSMKWLSGQATTFTKGLSFTYDGYNRLKESDGLDSYAETEKGITYDKNGNILTLVRAGSVVDNLAYTYSGEGNKVTSITDNSGNASGFKLGGAKAYTYDANGNMKTDDNRGTTITYNYLNLPSTVTITGSPTMSYNYDATGRKHQYIGPADTVKYVGPFEYNKVNTIKRVALTEGQAVWRRDTLWFDIYLKDNLGNVRVVLDDLGRTIQRSDYYAFGLAVNRDAPNVTDEQYIETNRYLYSNKETQKGTKYVDFGGRTYLPEIGRWAVVDPHSEKGRRWSPYIFSFNNPLNFSDPDGMWPYPITIRAFAPFKSFGFGYHGDGRGYSTNPKATARLHQTINFDTDKTSVTTKGWSSPTYRTGDPSGAKTASPSVSFTNELSIASSGDSKTFDFATHAAAANPKTPPGTPNIDVFSNFSITENKKAGTLNVSGTLNGDNFPSTEAFISDGSGQSVFLGVGQIAAGVGQNTGPFTELPGQNSDNPIMKFNITINTDKKGNFTSVQIGNRTFNLNEWNKSYNDVSPQKHEE